MSGAWVATTVMDATPVLVSTPVVDALLPVLPVEPEVLVPDEPVVPDDSAPFPLVTIGYTNTAPMTRATITTRTTNPAIRVFFPGIMLPRRFFWEDGAAAAFAGGTPCFRGDKMPARNPFFSGLRAACRDNGTGAGARSRSSSHPSDCGGGTSLGMVLTVSAVARPEGAGCGTGAAVCREAGCRGKPAGTTIGEPHLLQNAESAETLFPQRVQNTISPVAGAAGDGAA